jgi:hypothetical protein
MERKIVLEKADDLASIMIMRPIAPVREKQDARLRAAKHCPQAPEPAGLTEARTQHTTETGEVSGQGTFDSSSAAGCN